MADLRIFSYLPNPRIWKSTITARLGGVVVEVTGAPAGQIGTWLWDFDAHPMTDEEAADDSTRVRGRTGFSADLHKTAAFVRAHPYGTVPAAFSGNGQTGIFESNSIMRAVARLAPASSGIYGTDPFSASRIDSFLDVSLIFARSSQVYLLGFGTQGVTPDIYADAARSFDNWLSGIDAALSNTPYIAGASLTIADVCFACEVTLFSREQAALRQLVELGEQPVMTDWDKKYERAARHYAELCEHPAFSVDMADYLAKLGADVLRAKERHGS